MDFIKREIDTHDIVIAGNTYPAIFNYRAIIELEALTSTSHSHTLTKLENYDDEGVYQSGLNSGPIAAGEVAALVFGMLIAGGVKVAYVDLINSIGLDEQANLIKQAKSIIEAQRMPESKNVKTTTKVTKVKN